MKRDWDLIRQQLTDIEGEKDLFVELPKEPRWDKQSEGEYNSEYENYNRTTNRILGHLELLTNAGYVDGITIIRSGSGSLHYGTHSPRLTMAGHELLDTMRSKGLWERVKTKAKSEGIELTFDVINQLSSWAIKQLLNN